MTFLGLASGPYDLDRLDAFLLSPERADDVMSLEQLDGYLTAIALAPHMILPSEWLPEIWGEEEPVFADAEEAQAIHAAIMGLYNENLRVLADPDAEFDPIFAVDTDGSALIDPWAEGFIDGMALRADDWKPLFDDAALGSAIGLVAAVSLSGAEDGPDHIPMPKKEREQLYRDVPLFIPALMKDIRDFWRAKGLAPGPAPGPTGPTIKSLWLMRNGPETEDDEPQMPVRSVKIGRNEPCPCGSGKKYKRCCGA